VVCYRTAVAKGKTGRTSAHNVYALGVRCDSVYRRNGVPVAYVAEGFPAGFDGTGIFLRVNPDRSVRNDQPSARHRNTRVRRPRSQSYGRCHRQLISKTTENGSVSGFDAGKKIKGCKRHILTDTLGLMLFVRMRAADLQDRDGAPDLLRAIRYRFPWLRHIFADGGYAGKKLRGALKDSGEWTIASIRLLTRRLAR